MKEGKVLVPRTSDVSDITGITKLNLMHEMLRLPREELLARSRKR